MASVHNLSLLNEVIDTDTTTKGEALSLNSYAVDLIATCEVSDRTDGTYTLTIEHSPDGTNWFTLDSVAAISSEIMSIKATSNSCFQYVRASVLSASTTDGATVTCKLWFSTRK